MYRSQTKTQSRIYLKIQINNIHATVSISSNCKCMQKIKNAISYNQDLQMGYIVLTALKGKNIV